MRITPQHQQAIKHLVTEIAGIGAAVSVFGSRVDDTQRGGDLDLLVEVPSAVANPAWLIALLSAKISRVIDGRHVDVILSAPNLKTLAIHEQAKASGVPL